MLVLHAEQSGFFRLGDAGQADADLIVMSTHNPSPIGLGLDHLLTDSVATRVLRGTRLPVLLLLLARAKVAGRTGRQEQSNEDMAAIVREEEFVA